MTRVVLILAAPTLWDAEDRLAGSQSLPLLEPAEQSFEELVRKIDFPVDAIYYAASDEACAQVAEIVAEHFQRRPHKSKQMSELNVGLWGGLMHNQLKSRFPSAFPRWRESAILAKPPEGEALPDAIDRLRGALSKILRRNRNLTVVIVLRPMAMQILAGILRLQTPEQIGKLLHNRVAIETIDISEEDLQRYL